MKNIPFFNTAFSFFLAFVLLACGQETKTGEAETTTAQTTAPAGSQTGGRESAQISEDVAGSQGSGVDPSFLAMQAEQYAKILQGKWRSSTDANMTVEISGTKMKHLQAGKLIDESEIEIDASCKKSECKGAAGWCFIEKTKSGTQCNLILQVDIKNLHYRVMDTTGADLIYTKIGGE